MKARDFRKLLKSLDEARAIKVGKRKPNRSVLLKIAAHRPDAVLEALRS